MKAKIGNLEVIHSQVLLIPEGSDAWVEFRVASWDVKLHFVIVVDDDNPNESSYKLDGQEDHALIKLKNWNSPLGMAFSELVEFGTISEGNRPAYIMAFGHAVGNIMKLDFQIYLEELQ